MPTRGSASHARASASRAPSSHGSVRAPRHARHDRRRRRCRRPTALEELALPRRGRRLAPLRASATPVPPCPRAAPLTPRAPHAAAPRTAASSPRPRARARSLLGAPRGDLLRLAPCCAVAAYGYLPHREHAPRGALQPRRRSVVRARISFASRCLRCRSARASRSAGRGRRCLRAPSAAATRAIAQAARARLQGERRRRIARARSFSAAAAAPRRRPPFAPRHTKRRMRRRAAACRRTAAATAAARAANHRRASARAAPRA